MDAEIEKKIFLQNTQPVINIEVYYAFIDSHGLGGGERGGERVMVH